MSKRRRRTIEDAIECKICRRRLQSLQTHVLAAHGITGDEYRKRYKVDFLTSDRMRLQLSQTKTPDKSGDRYVPRTRADIVADLKAMNACQPFRNPSDLRQRAPKLWCQVVNHMGSAAELFRKLGFRTRECRTWSRESVLAELKKWNSARHPPGNALSVAAIRQFGSWKKALKAAGIHYDIVRTTRKQAISRAHKWAKRHGALSYGKLKATNPKLRHLLHNKFGGIEAAAKALGLPYQPAHTKWSRQRVIDQIKQRLRQGKRVRAMVVWREQPTLYKWGIRLFKSWDRVLRACGLDPLEHSYARELARASRRRQRSRSS